MSIDATDGRDWSRQFTAIAPILAFDADELVIDGEACAHCPEGLPEPEDIRRRGSGMMHPFGSPILPVKRDTLGVHQT